MTSKERHEARYQRRKAKRDQKLDTCQKSYDDVFASSNLFKYGKLCCDNVRWKTSIQNFERELPTNIGELSEDLENRQYKSKSFTFFKTIEHGKERDIAALHIRDRVVQKTINQECLLPIFSRSFVPEKCASIEGKGMDWAIREIKKDLAWHYRHYGTEGGIYQFDFTNYFGSLPHKLLKKRIKKKVKDPELVAVLIQMVDDFKKLKTVIKDENGEYYGAGLGSEVSQTFALEYISPIDHLLRDQMHNRLYLRYMDDGYIINEDLEKLREIDKILKEVAREYGVEINAKKSVITPFKSHSFIFLKFRFRLQENGKITIKLSRRSIKSVKRKLKIYKKKMEEGIMEFDDVVSSYQSWRAHAKRCNSYDTLKGMDKYFVNLYKKELANYRIAFKCTMKPVKKNGKWEYVERKKPQKTKEPR